MSDLGVANPYVKILTDTVQFDGVGTYSTKDNLTRAENGAYTGAEDPLVVKINKDCPNDYVINLNVTVSFGNGLDDSDTVIYENAGIISFAVRNGVVLPSQITEDMTLTKDNYYIIPNSTVIKEGVTVTVDPGTKIQFWSNDPEDPYADQYIAYLQVEGNFITNGTLEEPVELFPSELKDRYEVCLTEAGNGKIELNYTNVTNATLDISVADYCMFSQNYEGEPIYGRNYSSLKGVTEGTVCFNYKKIDFNNNDGFIARGFTIADASNSVFYKLGSESLVTDPNLLGNFTSCMFIDSALVYNGYQTDSGTAFYNGCVFVGNNVQNKTQVYSSYYLQSETSKKQLSGNVILNNYNDPDVNHWLRISAPTGSETAARDISGNYWGR